VQVIVDDWPVEIMCRSHAPRAMDRHPAVVRLVLTEALPAGDSVTLVWGDPGPEGNGRAIAQPFPEKDLPVRVRLRHASDGPDASPDELPRSGPGLEVGRGRVARLHVSGPSQVAVGEDVAFLVAALDSGGFPADAPVTDARVVATHTSGVERGPESSAAADDPCVTRFAFRLDLPGPWWISAAQDGADPAWDLPVVVAAERAAVPRLVWGDLHWHTNRSDGSRTPDEGYAYARDVVGLDFTARTDHDVHHRFPCLDGDKWEETIADTRRWNDAGRFAVLLGWEWTSGTGHMNVYFRGETGEMRPVSEHRGPQDLWAELPEDAITVPHHPAAVRQPTFDWNDHDERFVKPVEIYSNKGNSEVWEAPWAPVAYGLPTGRERASRRGTVQVGWAMGREYTVLASTDTHYGAPGTPVVQRGSNTRTGWAGAGLAAAWVEELTREQVWDAMKAGATYGTTGPRIRVEIAETATGVEAHVIGSAPLEEFELIGIPRTGEPPFAPVAGERIGAADHSRIGSIRWERTPDDGIRGVYVRVFQEDGEMAWSSPVFFQE